MPARSFLLVVLVVPLVACGSKRAEQARQQRAAIEVTMLTSVAEMAFATKGTCPSSVEQLKADGMLSSTSNTIDPWGSPYTLRCAPDPIVTSLGPDKKAGTADDIVKKTKGP